MARLSYGEIRARLRLSTGCPAPAKPSDDAGTAPMIVRDDAGGLIDPRALRFVMANLVERELTGA